MACTTSGWGRAAGSVPADRAHEMIALTAAGEAIAALRSGADVLPDRALAKRTAAGGPEPEGEETS